MMGYDTWLEERYQKAEEAAYQFEQFCEQNWAETLLELRASPDDDMREALAITLQNNLQLWWADRPALLALIGAEFERQLDAAVDRALLRRYNLLKRGRQ